jgi:hypothetical protein
VFCYLGMAPAPVSRQLTAAPVSIDPCVLASRHETIFERPEIEGARFRRLRQTQGAGRNDLLGFDAHHKAVPKAGAPTREALVETIRRALAAVRLEDASGWFAHAGYRPQDQSL